MEPSKKKLGIKGKERRGLEKKPLKRKKENGKGRRRRDIREMRPLEGISKMSYDDEVTAAIISALINDLNETKRAQEIIAVKGQGYN